MICKPATLEFEKELFEKGFLFVAGIDEVGRGPIAGPIVAAVVVLSKETRLPNEIADSKMLSEKKREYLSEKIKESAIDFAFGEVSANFIDKMGIARANQLAFSEAIENLRKPANYFLTDYFKIPVISSLIQRPVLGGDKLCVSVAAASIIAKVYRDNIMKKLGEEFPMYSWDKNKGYGTKKHYEALRKYGLTKHHRVSFL